MTMIKVNIHDAKTHLSKYLEQLREGDVIVICKRNVPIAEIHPIGVARSKKRPIGLAKGEFAVEDSFFEPLPDDLVDRFSGTGRDE